MRKAPPLVAVLAAAALLTASCTGAGEVAEGDAASLDVSTGVTDDSVRLGTHMPLTGPAAPGYSQISVGARAVFDYVNAQGGVHGRQIEYLVEDDGYDPVRTVEVVNELVLQDEIFAMVGGLGTPTHARVIDFLNEQGVPDLFVSSGALMWNQPDTHPLTFGYQVDYTREAKIQGQYVAENFPDASVGVFFQNDDVGTDTQAGLEQYLGEQIVVREPYESGNTDIGPQVSALEEAGAEVVICECIPTYMALLILESQAIGYEPQFVASSIGADTVTLNGLLQEFADADGGTADDMLDGLIATGYLPQATAADDPWLELYTQIYEEYVPEEQPFTNTLLYGMVQATQTSMALMAAGPDLTRQSLVDALHSGEFNGPGLVPFSTAEGEHSGFQGAYVTQYHAGGRSEILQEPRVTDRETGPIEEFDFSRPTPDEVVFYGG
ncbi:ABC transporter substrate-binding protein [Allonocardiopsis opalescens]|uniref:Amino acid/amide ABC transporter substrate-binding protein (HAAT family) n=1 Tax=Allonocardiopsis opalescens TaxID=1144618 RepID=A0A2T0Q146_9ACTN|nr:ABC transporter substrate-binding protein [Allonocardiopsis opalescens]PRX97403.1 amino acid/amide ABC transporter substrate-binding protein (HAAT family) [Allonocardiopsis opalescens]